MKAVRAVSIGLLLLAAAGKAQAQDSVPPAPAEEEERSTGLPGKVDWEFNFDAGLGAFGFSNSLYTNSRPDPSGDLSDNWVESYAKPALSGTYGLGKGALYGKVSAVGERTFAAPPSLVGEEASSFQVEDLYIGWRSGTALEHRRECPGLHGGPDPVHGSGTGFLLWDGGGEGGSRGGFWSDARKAWEFAGVARFKPKRHTFEAFYLDRDEVPESETGTQAVRGQLRIRGGRDQHARRELPALRVRFPAEPRRDVGLQPAGQPRARSSGCRASPSARKYAAEENGDLAGLDRVDTRRRRTAEQRQLEAQALLPLRVLRGRRPGRPPRTRGSIRCSAASRTGAHGGRARSRANTSSPTPTSSRTSCACT